MTRVVLLAGTMVLLASCGCTPHAPAVPVATAQEMTFSVVDRADSPCSISCGNGTCVLGFDRATGTVVDCANGYADTCACVD